MKILIFGVSGMLGHSLFRRMRRNIDFEVLGLLRDRRKMNFFTAAEQRNIQVVEDIINRNVLMELISGHRPDVILNALGVVKQSKGMNSGPEVVLCNAWFPHALAEIAEGLGSSLVHFSTDCVFDGITGGYTEESRDFSDDLYGRSKLVGEVCARDVLTIRTSIIGHEISSSQSLVDWFLSQKSLVQGFSNAIFSGLPTCYLADLLSEWISAEKLPSGIVHLSSEPISKFNLLSLIKTVYKHEIEIVKAEDPRINRSLNSDHMREKMDWSPPCWAELVRLMNDDYLDVKRRREECNV